MGMGGSGGAAQPSIEQRYLATYAANPGASPAELEASVNSGLTGMQYANYSIGQQIVKGDGKNPGAMRDVKRYGMQMRDLAQGGLMVRGLGQVRQALDAPNLAPGIQQRMGSRYGVQATPEQQAAMQQQSALTQASNRVGMTNMARAGLANAQRDIRFQGIGV